jgi:BED zinc finger
MSNAEEQETEFQETNAFDSDSQRKRRKLHSVWEHFIRVDDPERTQYGKAVCKYCKAICDKSEIPSKTMTGRPRNLKNHLKSCRFFPGPYEGDVS